MNRIKCSTCLLLPSKTSIRVCVCVCVCVVVCVCVCVCVKRNKLVNLEKKFVLSQMKLNVYHMISSRQLLPKRLVDSIKLYICE